jgi:hypothetical protein
MSTSRRVFGAVIAVTLVLGFAQLLPNSIADAGEAPQCAVIDNGTIRLGINDEGHLNCGDPAVEGGFVYGITYLPGGATNDALSPGCDCEGWGAGDATTTVGGHASVSNGGIDSVEVESFTATADSATSVVNIPTTADPTLRVTHDYHPSPDTALYQVDVTIENVSDAAIEPIYRRSMDWDVPPTEFAEFVTNQGTAAADDVTFASDDGFATADPFGADTSINFEGDAVDDGPADHGALFDFGFETLAPGDTKEFTIFYGAAGTEARANTALANVSAEMYSLGQPSSPDGAALGVPNTFIFAFQGIGGDVQFPSVAFTSSEYNANETDGTATITAQLSGTTGQDVTVNYATADGSAIAGEDYEATSGTLVIPAGDLDGTFEIPLIVDEATEDIETVQLTLSSPTIATLGEPSTAVLNILDVPPTAEPPPAPPQPAPPPFTG